MAVIPGNSNPIPNGAYSPSGLKALQDVTEESVKASVRGQVFPSMQNAKNSFFSNIIGGIGDAIKAALSGLSAPNPIFSPIHSAIKPVRDGQIDLEHRTDLVSPILDYGSVYMDAVEGWDNRGVMPFNKQIGPMRNLRLENNGLRLLDIGLWDIFAQITSSWIRLASAEVTWRIRVLRPNGSVFSEKRFVMTNANNMTMSLRASVVVPDPNYLVQVEVLTLGPGRGIIGGYAWNHLSAQHISRKVEEVNTDTGAGGVSSNPDGNIIGDSG